MNELVYSENDSKRFGLNIFRATMDEIHSESIAKTILDNEVDTAILRIPSHKLAQIERLEKLAMPFFIADTLIHYKVDLLKYQSESLVNPDIEFIPASQQHHYVLNTLVQKTFSNYVNHYRNNPFFQNQLVNEGYQDWVRSFASENPEGKFCWLLKRDGNFIGFACFIFPPDDFSECKGKLYGVVPDMRGQGIYHDIMRFSMNYAKSCGYSSMLVKTQIENRIVQRVWADMGFKVEDSENTIHINSLLRKTVFDPIVFPFTAKEDEYKTKTLANRLVLKEINIYFDYKQNISTLNHRFVNLKPLKQNEEYNFRLSYPSGNKGLLRIEDVQGEVCVLVYFDLKHFIV
jgi:GNAT superfamily N-acetyltransferase